MRRALDPKSVSHLTDDGKGFVRGAGNSLYRGELRGQELF